MFYANLIAKTRQPIGRAKFDLKHLQAVAYCVVYVFVYIVFK